MNIKDFINYFKKLKFLKNIFKISPYRILIIYPISIKTINGRLGVTHTSFSIILFHFVKTIIELKMLKFFLKYIIIKKKEVMM